MRFSATRTTLKSAGYTTRTSQLKRLKAYDNAEWNRFYRKYRAMVYGIAKRQHLSEEDSRDLMQEVIRVCCQRLQDFVYDPQRGRFRSFLWRLTLNLSFTFKRKMLANRTRPLNAQLSYAPEIDKILMQEYEHFLLHQSIAEMRRTIDSGTYEVFDLLVLQHRPVAEAVQITGKTPGALYSAKHRCLKKIRQIIVQFQAELENPSAQNPAAEWHTESHL